MAGGGRGLSGMYDIAPGRQAVSALVALGDQLPESALPQMVAALEQLSLSLEVTASPLDRRLLPACVETGCTVVKSPEVRLLFLKSRFPTPTKLGSVNVSVPLFSCHTKMTMLLTAHGGTLKIKRRDKHSAGHTASPQHIPAATTVRFSGGGRESAREHTCLHGRGAVGEHRERESQLMWGSTP